jgi:carbon-monoxide dehydrogenase medium subunit
MKSRKAEYHRANSIADAVAMLAESEDPVILAGGQSLVAALNLRLQAPTTIVDINWIPGLDRIEERDGEIVVGALVRHNQLARSALVAEKIPLVHRAMEHVAHPAIRNRGTTCGSLSYADPAAEMPACAVLLGATLKLVGPGGEREVAAREFYYGIYDTDREPDELIVEARFPVVPDGVRTGFGEVTRRHGDFASVGIAAKASVAGRRLETLDIVAFASEPAPLLCASAAELAAGQEWSEQLLTEIVDAVSSEMDPMDSPLGSPEVKRRQARALLRTVLSAMME